MACKICKESRRFYKNIGVIKGRKISDHLPRAPVKASQF